MPRGPLHQPPARYVASGKWPEVVLTSEAPPSAQAGLAFARNLDAAMRAHNLSDRALARRAGLSHPTIGALRRGEVLPDLGTIVLLEIATGDALYPADLHRQLTLPEETRDGTPPPQP
ncbi:helix-turn-helix domain-containing protein [Kitasatospora sp. NPDC088346]|uniref:helix-turn-helix domain-containing protein n=1 Tax=Kitasatospora sp. NPDC088346 TaxID=3364073 RepID=UPI003816CB5E